MNALNIGQEQTGRSIENVGNCYIFHANDNFFACVTKTTMSIWRVKNMGRMAESGLRHRF